MKILHVIFRMLTGGAEMMLIDIARRQAADGHRVALMVINSGSDPKLLDALSPSVEIYQLHRCEGSRSPLPVVAYNLRLLAFDPDVIHVHNERAVNMMLPPMRRKVIQTLHTTGIRLAGCQTKTPLVSISGWVASDLMQRQGLDSRVIYNGIDFANISCRRPTTGLKRLVCVARLDSSVKGQDLLLRALASPTDTHPHLAGCHLSIIGGGPDEDSLKKLAADLGVASRVEFLGSMKRADVYRLLPQFDLFVLPSRQEGFGLVLAEAMAAALPVVACNLPGPLEIMNGGRHGLSFLAGSAESLADTLEKAALNWTGLQQQAAGPALEFVKSNFNVAATARNYIELYKSTLKIDD